jgi:hypothetical protein
VSPTTDSGGSTHQDGRDQPGAGQQGQDRRRQHGYEGSTIGVGKLARRAARGTGGRARRSRSASRSARHRGGRSAARRARRGRGGRGRAGRRVVHATAIHPPIVEARSSIPLSSIPRSSAIRASVCLSSAPLSSDWAAATDAKTKTANATDRTSNTYLRTFSPRFRLRIRGKDAPRKAARPIQIYGSFRTSVPAGPTGGSTFRAVLCLCTAER